MRNAVELFARAGVVPELKGSGSRVVRQSPPPGVAWPSKGKAQTIFYGSRRDSAMVCGGLRRYGPESLSLLPEPVECAAFLRAEVAVEECARARRLKVAMGLTARKSLPHGGNEAHEHCTRERAEDGAAM